MMARKTVWLVMFDKPGSGEIPDGGETRLVAYSSATAAKRGAAEYAAIHFAERKRYPWIKEREGRWVAEWEENGDDYILEAIEVDVLTVRDV